MRWNRIIIISIIIFVLVIVLILSVFIKYAILSPRLIDDDWKRGDIKLEMLDKLKQPINSDTKIVLNEYQFEMKNDASKVFYLAAKNNYTINTELPLATRCYDSFNNKVYDSLTDSVSSVNTPRDQKIRIIHFSSVIFYPEEDTVMPLEIKSKKVIPGEVYKCEIIVFYSLHEGETLKWPENSKEENKVYAKVNLTIEII